MILCDVWQLGTELWHPAPVFGGIAEPGRNLAA
jgi:hypothetical protein